MSKLLQVLDFIVLSELEKKLSPAARIIIHSPNGWGPEDVKHILTPQDKRHIENIRMFLTKHKHKSRYSYYFEYSAYCQFPTSHQSRLFTIYRPLALPPPIIRTSHPNAPAPFMIIPPLIPGSFPPIFLFSSELRPMRESHYRNDKKVCSSTIVDFSSKSWIKTYLNDTKRNIEPSLNPSINVPLYSNEVKDLALLCSKITSAPSDLASFPSPPQTDYISDIVAHTCPETFEYNTYPSYTTATNMVPGSYSASIPTPPTIDHDVTQSCNPTTSEYYSHPSYTTTTTITPAISNSSIFPLPPTTNYTYDTANSTCYTGTSMYSYPSYTTATNIIPGSYSESIPTPPSTDYDLMTSCYPETFENYSYPSYTTATTINPAFSDSTIFPTPPPINYTSNVSVPGIGYSVNL